MCIRTFSQGTRIFVPHSKSGSVIVFFNSHFLLVDEIIATNEKQPLKLKSLGRMQKKEEDSFASYHDDNNRVLFFCIYTSNVDDLFWLRM